MLVGTKHYAINSIELWQTDKTIEEGDYVGTSFYIIPQTKRAHKVKMVQH